MKLLGRVVIAPPNHNMFIRSAPVILHTLENLCTNVQNLEDAARTMRDGSQFASRTTEERALPTSKEGGLGGGRRSGNLLECLNLCSSPVFYDDGCQVCNTPTHLVLSIYRFFRQQTIFRNKSNATCVSQIFID